MNKNITYTIFQSDDFQNLIAEGLDVSILELIAHIKQTYPFTFLEKENLRKKIDRLDNFFWMKNRHGFCELVNQPLSEYFHSSPLQLEGNHEEMFFSADYHPFIKSFNEVIAETKRPILVESIRFLHEQEDKYFNLVSFPIINEENTVMSFISFTILEKKGIMKENYSQIAQIMDMSSSCLAILTLSGSIINANNKFHEFITNFDVKPESSLINGVFLPNFYKILKDFVNSKSSETRLSGPELLPNKAGSYSILLGKIFDEKHNTKAILLTINQQNKEIAGNSSLKITMLENLVRNNPDAVLICDKENLKFLEVNETAVNLYGYRKEEFFEMDLTDLYSPEDIQLLLDSSSANIREGAFHGPYKHKKKDGKIILVEMSRYSIRYKDREAHLNIIKNITDKLDLDKRNQSLKSVFDLTNDLIFITDISGFISFINQSVTNITGYTKNDLINSSFTSLVTDEDRSSVIQSLFNLDMKNEQSLDVMLNSVDGKLLPVNIIASPIFDYKNEIESFTLLGKIRQAILPQEATKTAEAVRISESVVENTTKLDINFLKELFHELLTPINVILGFAQDITENKSQISPEQKEAADIISHNRKLLLNSMNTAIEYFSVNDKEFTLSVTEIRITDAIDLLEKELKDSKETESAELAYGKISSSLKFATDQQKFNYFLLLLFKIVTELSGQKKIYFSAYPKDKEQFYITFRDLQTHCSKSLISNLNKIFGAAQAESQKSQGISGVKVKLATKLIKILNGKYSITSESKDRNDYVIAFPIILTSDIRDQRPLEAKQEKQKFEDYKIPDRSEPIASKQEFTHTIKPKSDERIKSKIESAEKLRNELRIESLREKIRKKEMEKSQPDVEKDSEDFYEASDKEELIEDKIEYFDLDLHENTEDETSVETIEVIETSSTKEKVVDTSNAVNTDEKVDLSKFSCLYFEDQIDSQILYSVQMKGLKNLNFAVSFEESLPLLESGNYDFIVIDINLQGSYNGLDILRIIRSMPKYENIPVFAVTAYVLPGDQQKFVLAGFSGFISKPIFRDQMIDLLAEVFNEPQQF